MQTHAASLRLMSFGLILTVMTGCGETAFLNWTNFKFPEKIPTADEKNPAVRIVCIWEPAQGRGVSGAPSRGFAGQILFFQRGNPSPLMVEGDVRIYLFDEHGSPEEQAKPIRQFDFIGGAWTSHGNLGQLGPSYHIFIPYVRKHSYETRCSLRVRLKPTAGPVIFSEPVSVTLPGRKRETETDAEGPAVPLLNDEQGETLLGASIKQFSVKLGAAAGPVRQVVSQKRRSQTNDEPAELQSREDWLTDEPLRLESGAGKARSLSQDQLLDLYQNQLRENHRMVNQLKELQSEPRDGTLANTEQNRHRFKLTAARFPKEEDDDQPRQTRPRRFPAMHPLSEAARQSPSRRPVVRRLQHPLVDHPQHSPRR